MALPPKHRERDQKHLNARRIKLRNSDKIILSGGAYPRRTLLQLHARIETILKTVPKTVCKTAHPCSVLQDEYVVARTVQESSSVSKK